MTVIPQSVTELVIAVHIEKRDATLWFAPELVEFLDHAAGTEIQLDGVAKKWTRTEDGEWKEESLEEEKSPWWKFW